MAADEPEVHEHQGDRVGAAERAVAAPDHTTDGDQDRRRDQAALDHVERDLDLGRGPFEASA